MFGMALTRPMLTTQLTSGVDTFAHVSAYMCEDIHATRQLHCQQKANTSSNYCDNIQPLDKKFQFLSNVTQFLDSFFLGGGELPQIRTSNFHKVLCYCDDTNQVQRIKIQHINLL